MESNEKTNDKRHKMRSRLYPRYDLEEAVNFINIINKLGGRNVAISAVAAESGSAVNSSAFLGRLSSSKQFGLIVTENGKISLSKLGNEIIFPREEKNKLVLLRTAFNNPPFYKELINDFLGKSLPEPSTFGNRLIHDYKIEVKAKDKAATNFIRSAEYVGAIKNGILIMNEGGVSDIANSSKQNMKDQGNNAQPYESTGGNFVFNFVGGISLVIPRTMETKEAVMDGELKEINKGLNEFAEKYLSKDNPEDSEH